MREKGVVAAHPNRTLAAPTPDLPPGLDLFLKMNVLDEHSDPLGADPLGAAPVVGCWLRGTSCTVVASVQRG